MIDFVRGIIAEKEPGRVTIEAHGVGYELFIPLSVYERLNAPGSEAKLYAHFHVREDAQRLFGFLTKKERELFRRLITISSIGPKTAIGILSKMTADELIRCVATGDASRLTKIPGVGAKTAGRLLVELRDTFTMTGFGGAEQANQAAGIETTGRISGAREEAVEALVSLGYNDKQVARAVERVAQTLAGDGGAEAGVEEWIKKALQVI
ncbi:MAG: Holliday junction branch migration protein RuvA [Chitinispirillaceae bacterium]|nr:Holliday junction branch migration protein RuvA [Chitinispirillaceae bacterium]